MIQILKAQLSAEWNKPKAKNAREGQEVRNEDFIKELQGKINAIKQDEVAGLNEALIAEHGQPVDFNDYDLLGEQVSIPVGNFDVSGLDELT